MTVKSAAAPASETASSSSGVSPLVPIAPTTSPSTISGMPPVSADAPCSASAPRRPPVTCSSISRLGRTKIAAVRALSTATRELAIWAPGVRRSSTTSPHGSTTVITTRWPCSSACRSAAAITVSAPASSMILRVRTVDMGQAPWRGMDQIASSAVTSRRSPAKAKLTAPGRSISRSRAPAGEKTSRPAPPVV